MILPEYKAWNCGHGRLFGWLRTTRVEVHVDKDGKVECPICHRRGYPLRDPPIAVFMPCEMCGIPTFRGRLHIKCGRAAMRTNRNLDRVNRLVWWGTQDYKLEADRARKRLREATALLKAVEPLLDRGREKRQVRGRVRMFLELD